MNTPTTIQKCQVPETLLMSLIIAPGACRDAGSGGGVSLFLLEAEPALPQGVQHGFGARADPHLVEDAAEVGLNRPDTEGELAGDVFVADALARQAEDLHLALAQGVPDRLLRRRRLSLSAALDHP